jgi:hypothetical protein
MFAWQLEYFAIQILTRNWVKHMLGRGIMVFPFARTCQMSIQLSKATTFGKRSCSGKLFKLRRGRAWFSPFTTKYEWFGHVTLFGIVWMDEKQLDIWRTELHQTSIWFGLSVAYPWGRKHQRLLLKVLTPWLQVYISSYSIVSARGCHVCDSLLS